MPQPSLPQPVSLPDPACQRPPPRRWWPCQDGTEGAGGCTMAAQAQRMHSAQLCLAGGSTHARCAAGSNKGGKSSHLLTGPPSCRCPRSTHSSAGVEQYTGHAFASHAWAPSSCTGDLQQQPVLISLNGFQARTWLAAGTEAYALPMASVPMSPEFLNDMTTWREVNGA